jgi:uncharacterized membrane protein YdfJ with MMPL/SSD domain
LLQFATNGQRRDRAMGAAVSVLLLFGLSMDYQVFLLSRIKEE